MKNLNTILKKSNWLFVLLFGGMTMSFAQSITVPANCRVVNVGTGVGGLLGYGGRVTEGGIVAMPDQLLVSPFTPNQGGTFTFNPPGGVATASWLLKGDLSNAATAGTIPGVTGNYNGVTQPAAALTANIISYNKSYRPNSTETANPSWARSKGQVKVSWVLTGCGSSITFDVYKNFTQSPPAIVGPDCLKPNTEYTYSVDRIVSDNAPDNIGFDSYYWSGLPTTLINAPGYYTSADNSSITFKTGATVTGFTLKCCYGRVNPDTADGGVSTVTQAVTGTHTTCSANKVLLVAPTAPVFSATTLSTLASLNSTSAACLPIGTGTFTITYPNVPVTVPATVYTWTAPNQGWTFNTVVSGTTTTTVNTNGNNNPGTLVLTITGPCDPAIYNYQINRSIAAPVAIVPTLPTTTCIGGTSTNNNYTISPAAVGVTLTWTTNPPVVAGVTLTPSGNTNSVMITTSGAAAGTFTLQAQGTAPCNSTMITLPINVQPAAPIFTGGTPSCVLRSGVTQVTTVACTPGGATVYDWTPYPAGVTCVTGCATSNPTFIFNSAVGVNSVVLAPKIIGTGGCNSPTTPKTINYLSVNGNFPGGGFADQYAVNAACGVVNFWTVNGTNYATSSGNVGISGANNNILSISGTGGAPITQVCANITGFPAVCATTFGTSTLRPAATSSALTDAQKEMWNNVVISPNPNSGIFNIKVLNIKESATASLIDSSGNEIQTYPLRKGDNKIERHGLRSGTYFVVLRIDGTQQTRQIVVN
jgi:hypothetical protein